MVDLIPSINSTELIVSAIKSTMYEVPYFWGILKTAGLVFIAYVLFLFVKGFMTFKTNKRIRKIEKKVNLILEKLELFFEKEGLDFKSGKKKKKKEKKVKFNFKFLSLAFPKKKKKKS